MTVFLAWEVFLMVGFSVLYHSHTPNGPFPTASKATVHSKVAILMKLSRGRKTAIPGPRTQYRMHEQTWKIMLHDIPCIWLRLYTLIPLQGAFHPQPLASNGTTVLCFATLIQQLKHNQHILWSPLWSTWKFSTYCGFLKCTIPLQFSSAYIAVPHVKHFVYGKNSQLKK